MEEVRWKSATEWLEKLDTCKEAGHDVEECSDPLRRVLGFRDHTDNQHHIITLHHLKNTLPDLEKDVASLLQNPEVRTQLVEGS